MRVITRTSVFGEKHVEDYITASTTYNNFLIATLNNISRPISFEFNTKIQNPSRVVSHYYSILHIFF